MWCPQSRIVDCLCSTVHVVWTLHITQRTHAMSLHVRGLNVYSYIHPPTKWTSAKTHNSSSHGQTSPTTAAWAHLRALRDTGNTCHGTPYLGEGPSGAHAFTCPWNAKRRRQDNGCMCMCAWEHVVGIPRPLEANRPSDWHMHRMHAELWTSGPQLVTGT